MSASLSTLRIPCWFCSALTVAAMLPPLRQLRYTADETVRFFGVESVARLEGERGGVHIDICGNVDMGLGVGNS